MKDQVGLVPGGGAAIAAPQQSRSGESSAAAGAGLLIGIQMLRGCAALLVILAHANLMMRYPRYFHQSPFDIREAGVFGVTVFFAISGFIIAIVSLDGDLRARLTIRDFAWRRFVRIMPFLWLAVIGYNILTYVGTRDIEWMNALRALVIWPVGGLKPNVIWSLRHELIFYALFAATLMVARQRWWLLGAWFLAPLIVGVSMPLIAGRQLSAGSTGEEFLHVLLMGSDNGANLQFGAGFLLGILYLKRHAWLQPRRVGGLATVLGVVAAATILVEAMDMPVGLARSCLWTMLAGVIVWIGIVCERSPRWIERIGILLGNASFAIYLTHNGVLLTAFEAATKLRLPLPTELLFFVFVALATGVGLIVHLIVEKPLIALLSRRRIAPWQRQNR
ncbi:acyltransferase family protein [Allosphingosinicella deserti]|uniref:acyltransferase family protein n=1 Tax=Allosphingosinicella deserti TaxID=2116704 RepID=UPI001304BCD1|nr:acyltransferase [Sphingomonas deserti]